jgi:hypothetical protein
VNSLSAHLVAGPEHGRLRFHPDCPFCRKQRLAGPLSDAVLPARAQAGLLAAALSAGTLLPAGGAAADPTTEKAPTARASQTPPPSDPPVVVDETQEAPVDEAPDLRELLTNPDLGSDSAGEDVGADAEATEPAAPEPLAEAPVEPAPVAPPPTASPAPPAPAPAPPTPPPVELPPAAVVDEATLSQAPSTTTERQALKLGVEPRRRGRPLVANSHPSPQPVAPAPVVEAPAPSAPVETVAISQPAPPTDGPIGGRGYTVQPGDSLWLIARRLLGADASNGQIAREVNRLWRLNQERIGTGDPSLIHIGTELRLR